MHESRRRAVVTGASGFIGSALVRYLSADGWDVVSVDRKPSADGNQPARFRGVFEVLEAARHAGSRVVFPSTASIFDASNALPLSERAFPRPTSPYAAGKLGGEAYCHAYHRSYGVDVRIARLFSVYGVGMFRFAIHDIVRKIQQDHEGLAILGDGMQVRDYLFIDDAVRGLTMVATEGASGEEYNVASGEPVRLLDLARLIGELMGYPHIRITPTGRSFPGDTARWYADISKVRGLGFEPRVDLRTGLERTIAWLATRPIKTAVLS